MLLSCNDLKIGYSKRIILDNVTFEINEGDYLCIIGENGSGKSTLIKTILGLIKPISGKIVLSKEFNKKEIGYLPQRSITQNDFPASCYEVVLSGCINKLNFFPWYTNKQKQLADENMEKLCIKRLKNQCFSELSGGQQQRVLLARALCATEKILILDEPVSGLDSKATSEMYKIIRNINKQGIAIVMITHNAADIFDDATHIIEINHKGFYWNTKAEFIKRVIALRKENRGIH